MVKLIERSGGYEVLYENGVHLGEILAKEDGFYDFWPDLKGGYWDAGILHQLANLLDELNKPWQEQIERDLGGTNGTAE